MIALADAQRATGGRWLRCPLPPETVVSGGTIDTRALGDAQIFFALTASGGDGGDGGAAGGDGHRFLPQLAGSGVRLAVVQRDVTVPGFEGAVLRVEDSLRALQELAHWLVEAHRPRVVAITGSYGKTTAKDTVAHVLAGHLPVLHSPGSFNNEIGIPLTLLGLDGTQPVAVLEFAARHPGDIDLLGRIAPPDIALLLNVGRAHVGVFGSIEATYRAKGEIFNHLRPGGLALVGAEDPRLRELAAPHRTLGFGRDAGDFHAEQIELDGLGRLTFTAVHGADRLTLTAAASGAHTLHPMLAAWAVTRELGVPDALVVARAGGAPRQKGRSGLISAPGGATVVDDTYNASPETVINLIATLAAIEAPEKVLVLGHLSELEEGLAESVRTIGAHLRPPLAELWIHDPGRPQTAAQFRAEAQGVKVRELPDMPALIEALRERDRPGTVIGIKGGRAAHMERAVHGLLGGTVTCRLHPCGLLKHCTDCEALSA